MAVEKMPDWFAHLQEEDVAFIKRFLLASGSLKEVASQYGVTYPTVRLRLDKLIGKINAANHETDDPFVAMVKQLTLDEKIDLETAKQLVKAHNKTRRD